MGADGFVWFTGVVEDRDDPSLLGRVRVRCVGYHTEDKTRLPTETLPWAHVMHPVTDPSMGGMGMTPTFMVEGTWVIGFFRDAEEKQQPVIIGTLPGVPTDTPNTNIGFNDPNGKYPKSTRLDESDVNRLARSETGYLHESQVNKAKHRIDTDTEVGSGFTEIPTAGGASFNEPSSAYAAKYPYNHVFETESGHIKEFDDTEGEERIHEYHTSGTYYEVAGSGTRTVKIVGDGYHIIAGSDYAYVDGHCNLTVASDCNTYVQGNYNLRVDGNMEVMIKGNKKETILCNDDEEEGHVEEIIKSGKKQVTVDGEVIEVFGDKYSIDVKGKTTQIFAGGLQSNITGVYDIDVGNDPADAENLGKITINTPTIETEVTTFSLDAETSATITSATSTINGSTATNIKGAAVNISDSGAESPDVTLPTIGNGLLIKPLITPTFEYGNVAEFEGITGAKHVNKPYMDAVMRHEQAEKKLGIDSKDKDGMESGDSGGNSRSPITNGSVAVPTDYDPKANYCDSKTPNSSPYVPYDRRYSCYDADVPIERRQKYDEDGLLNFINSDPRINPALGSILVELTRNMRVILDKPKWVLPITSAFRTPAANEACGGATLSQHKSGNAVDVLMINIPRENQKEFLDEAISLGIKGVGAYFPTINSGKSFFHLDIGDKRAWGPTGRYGSQYAWVKQILNKYATTGTKGVRYYGISPIGKGFTEIAKTDLDREKSVKTGPGT